MSKKDYEKAAQIVREMSHGATVAEVSLVMGAFVRLFSDDNPRFDAQQFMQACMAGAS